MITTFTRAQSNPSTKKMTKQGFFKSPYVIKERPCTHIRELTVPCYRTTERAIVCSLAHLGVLVLQNQHAVVSTFFGSMVY